MLDIYRTLSLTKPAYCSLCQPSIPSPKAAFFESYLARVHVRQVEGIPGELGRTAGRPLDEVGVLGACERKLVRNRARRSKRTEKNNLRVISQMRSAETLDILAVWTLMRRGVRNQVVCKFS